MRTGFRYEDELQNGTGSWRKRGRSCGHKTGTKWAVGEDLQARARIERLASDGGAASLTNGSQGVGRSFGRVVGGLTRPQVQVEAAVLVLTDGRAGEILFGTWVTGWASNDSGYLVCNAIVSNVERTS